jgi:hypothetical protein
LFWVCCDYRRLLEVVATWKTTTIKIIIIKIKIIPRPGTELMTIQLCGDEHKSITQMNSVWICPCA